MEKVKRQSYGVQVHQKFFPLPRRLQKQNYAPFLTKNAYVHAVKSILPSPGQYDIRGCFDGKKNNHKVCKSQRKNKNIEKNDKKIVNVRKLQALNYLIPIWPEKAKGKKKSLQMRKKTHPGILPSSKTYPSIPPKAVRFGYEAHPAGKFIPISKTILQLEKEKQMHKNYLKSLIHEKKYSQPSQLGEDRIPKTDRESITYNQVIDMLNTEHLSERAWLHEKSFSQNKMKGIRIQGVIKILKKWHEGNLKLNRSQSIQTQSTPFHRLVEHKDSLHNKKVHRSSIIKLNKIKLQQINFAKQKMPLPQFQNKTKKLYEERQYMKKYPYQSQISIDQWDHTSDINRSSLKNQSLRSVKIDDFEHFYKY